MTRAKLVLFAVIPGLVLFVVLELGLRLAGFEYSDTVLAMRQKTSS